jgi:hypothetical protein
MTEFVINKIIRIVTRFSYSTTASTEKMPVISYELFYPAHQSIPLMTGLLAGDNKQDIKCKASDGFLHGCLRTTVSREEIVLLGNLFYGASNNLALQSHFDGTVVIYPLKHHPVPPPPPPDNGGSGDDLEPDISIGAPLFPYIDVQPWPTATTASEPWQFFRYDPVHTTADSLYSLLIPLAVAKDRAGMEALALQFLQNEAPFTGQYFNKLHHVPLPFNRFPAIYDLLKADDATHHYEEILLTQTGYENHEQFVSYLLPPDYEQVKDQVWQNYFAMAIFTGYQEHFFVEINKILLIINLIDQLFPAGADAEKLPERHLSQLLQATVVLPGNIFPLPPYHPVVNSAGQIEPYAIGRLKMARYRLLCYRQGEIARIQNVLKGEKKKVVHRSLTHNSEQSIQHTLNTNDQSNESKETTHELLTEVKKTVAALTKKISYDKFTVTYGPPNQAVYGGSWKKEILPEESVPAKEDANHFASRVLNKTLSRIQDSVFRSRASFTFNEKEEIESSLFDNQHGHNFRGIYRWVNKVYRISVENYGYRFLLALQLENPAGDFIASQLLLNNTNLKRPDSPLQQKISSFSDITPENYIALFSYYQVNKVLLPPEATVTTGITLSQGETEKYIPVPAGYLAATASVTGQIAAGATLKEITGIIGTTAFKLTNTTPKQEDIALGQEMNQVAVAVNGTSMPPKPPVQPSDFILIATITCAVSDNKLNEWKIAVYNEIMTAYQQLMQQYNDQLTRFAREDQQSNPLLLNNIEKSCLYNSCVAMLLKVHAQTIGEQSLVVPPGQPVGMQRYRQFMGEALEWDEMTWCFDDQPAKYTYALQGPDDSLRPFLQAATATVFLPVRPDYNLQVLYYLSAGMLWGARYPFIPVNNASVPIALHLKNIPHWHQQRQEEKHWHVTLPMAMQVIQEGTELPDFITSKYE